MTIKSLQKIEKTSDRNEIGRLIGFADTLMMHAMRSRNHDLEEAARDIPKLFVSTHDSTFRSAQVSKILQRFKILTHSYLQAKNMLGAADAINS